MNKRRYQMYENNDITDITINNISNIKIELFNYIF